MTNWAYYRVSTDEQDYENQKSGVVRYCEYKGLEIDKEVIEEGVSGKIEYELNCLLYGVKQCLTLPML